MLIGPGTNPILLIANITVRPITVGSQTSALTPSLPHSLTPLLPYPLTPSLPHSLLPDQQHPHRFTQAVIEQIGRFGLGERKPVADQRLDLDTAGLQQFNGAG